MPVYAARKFQLVLLSYNRDAYSDDRFIIHFALSKHRRLLLVWAWRIVDI